MATEEEVPLSEAVRWLVSEDTDDGDRARLHELVQGIVVSAYRLSMASQLVQFVRIDELSPDEAVKLMESREQVGRRLSLWCDTFADACRRVFER